MTQNNLGNTLWKLGEREKRIWKRRSQPFARRSRNTGTLVGPCGTDVTISRSGRSATRLRSIRAMSTGTIRAETFWCGRAEQGRPCRGSLRFDRGHLLTANSLCWAHYFLCRYNEAVETADRAFSRGPGSSVEMITLRFLRPRTARWDDQDAEGERDHHVSVPLFEARTFAGQFGTQEAGDHLLEGPKKPGFIEHRRVRARSPKLAESRLKPVTNTTIN